MNTPPARGQSAGAEPDVELLSAYLDGEIVDSDRTAIEDRLQRDANFRVLLRSMQKTWESLDALTTSNAESASSLASDFTRSTMILAVSEAKGEIESARRSANMWKAAPWLAGVAASLLAGWLGFASVRRAQTADDRALMKDLPVIMLVDELQYTDMEFAVELQKSGLFAQEGPDEL